MNKQKALLKAIEKPRTIKEIIELTGLTRPQIAQAFKGLGLKGATVEHMGFGSHEHHYLPKYKQPKMPEFLYQRIINIAANTGEWWCGNELAEIADTSTKYIASSLLRAEKLGYVRVKRERRDANRQWYYMETDQ